VQRANYVDGAFVEAARGATFRTSGAGDWPQSAGEDVVHARAVARSASKAWAALEPEARAEHLRQFGRALERETALVETLMRAFELERGEAELHLGGSTAAVASALAAARPGERPGLAWFAPDWRNLVSGTLPALLRELLRGHAPIVVSDGRLPEVAQTLALAAHAAGLPRGVLQVLHGPTRELVGLGLEDGREDLALCASGSLERMAELRRLCVQRGLDPRLAALRAGAAEILAGDDLALAAREMVERAFGRGQTLGGQLSGTLARVHCPARLFARFSELLLEALAVSPAARRPVPQLDGVALARAQAACELGLDEGATLIAGGESDVERRTFAPAVLTNVEPYMESARRQEPVPVLCLLRA